MKLLTFTDWCDKYGYQELEEYREECYFLDMVPEEEDEWLDYAYEAHISEYEDRCYSNFRDRGNTWDN